MGGPSGEVVKGDLQYDGRVILYILKGIRTPSNRRLIVCWLLCQGQLADGTDHKADMTNYINYIKPLLLAEELQFPHVFSVIDTKSEWYYNVHPERYVPALKDHDPDTQKDLVVFEGTTCLQYLADRYDEKGIWKGKGSWEKAQILSCTAYQTAGLGATAKYWLYFSKGYPNRQNPEALPKTVAKLHANALVQWDKLENRLSAPEQLYVALPDRPALADISYFPFTMPWMFSFLQVNINDWPYIKSWAERMLSRTAVKTILEKGPSYGHDLD